MGDTKSPQFSEQCSRTISSQSQILVILVLFAAPACTDVAPSKDFTCAQQKSFGKCNQAFMKNYCNKSCGRCGTATAKPTSMLSSSSLLMCPAFEHYARDKRPCKAPLQQRLIESMACCTGAPAVKAPAPAGCADVAPSKDYTCAQQKAFGKCNVAFMKGFCNNSCGRCPAAAGPATRVAGPVAAPAATVAPTPPATCEHSLCTSRPSLRCSCQCYTRNAVFVYPWASRT